jgi:hypothetical protein
VVGLCNEETSEYDEFYCVNKRGEQAITDKFALANYFFKGLAHVKLKSGRKPGDEDEEAEGTFAYIAGNGRRIFTYWGERCWSLKELSGFESVYF